MCQSKRLYGITFHKTVTFIVSSVKTSNIVPCLRAFSGKGNLHLPYLTLPVVGDINAYIKFWIATIVSVLRVFLTCV